ncbi:MAG TPA: carbohydrate kinase [Aestuariivirga sp.]|nr:carbohydrate kinase [Aestuariivirga sp.]
MIVCCGEALIDFLPRISSEGAAVYQPFCGGSIYNTAIALGRLGIDTGLFTGISTDFFGDQLREGLKASKVDLKYIKHSGYPSMLAFVKLEGGQARYSFFNENSASRMLTRKDLPKLAAKVRALHFGSISLIAEPGATSLEALMRRETKTRVICLDPNIRPTVIADRRAYLARISRMIGLCDILKISDEDVAWMTGKTDAAAAARKWLKAGARIVAVTKGGEGVEAFTARFTTRLPSVPVEVADTVGAGDTFTAGLLAALAKARLLDKKALAAISENDLRDALAFAARAAAITVSRPGADPPWAHELDKS